MNTQKSNNNEARVEGVWEPTVKIGTKGAHAAIGRKVLTKGRTYFIVHLQEITKLLRSGQEVLLTDNADSDSGIRLYPCMDKGVKEMFVAAQTMGDFRKTLNDVKFNIVSRGQRISRKTCDAMILTQTQRFVNAKREAACPTRVVECPKCGYEFEIGGLKAK